MDFHNGSNGSIYNKRASGRIKKNKLLVQGRTLKNIQHLQFQQKKKLQELIKLEKKLQKLYLTYYNWLIVQDLWQAQYQILLKIDLNDFVESNVNQNILIKNTMWN